MCCDPYPESRIKQLVEIGDGNFNAVFVSQKVNRFGFSSQLFVEKLFSIVNVNYRCLCIVVII